MASVDGVLLDTCAVIWLANGDLPQAAVDRVMLAALRGCLFVSTVSAWEVGLLSAPKGNRPAVRFMPDPATWFAAVLARPGIWETPLTADIAIAASLLPGTLHRDPGDRLLIATARSLNVALMTRDHAIRAYAGQGHVEVVEC